MVRINRMKQPLSLLIALILLIVTALPAYAADSTVKQAEIRVKVGSSQMTINAEKIKIQPPYNSGKIAMVPLSVFTNAKGFGATLKPTGKNLQITYLKHILIVTKGSKAATFDGKKATLPVAPVDKSGVTMIPVESIAKALGIKLTTDAKTKELVLKGASATPAAAGNSIDSDAGKNKVGDSYYKWSMNMPTNLAQDEQWDKGSKITFADVKGEFYMAVFVDKAEEALDASEQSGILKDYSDGDTTIDVGSVKVGANTFQRIITKDSGGFFYEYRGIQHNGYFYTVIFGTKAKSKAELDAYKGLLDSFQTSFDAANKSLKDLSIVKNGKIAYVNANYGLKLQLPVAWSEDKDPANTGLAYSGPEGAELSFDVHSIIPNDTLDAWLQRDVKNFEDMSAEAYRKPIETIDITWNGVPAKQSKIVFTMDKKTWIEITSISAIKGNYKYEISLTYPQEQRAVMLDVLYEMSNGMKVDFATVEKNFGQVPDPDDTKDLTTLVTKSSKKFGYNVTIPKYWVDGTPDMDANTVHFGGDESDFIVEVYSIDSTEGVEDILTKNVTEGGVLKKDASTKVTFAGTTATKLEFSSTALAESNIKVVMYFFAKNGNVYIVESVMHDFFASPMNTTMLQNAIDSFTVN
ncbi:copper amine oxidase N-terminal domain-containing protein [Cohnella yongneupensis]|uniref:Copper amine oxidase N-terminal domain-containing protein n=1 Tax=Cohnella yongneupensis TaxID=425006 RepID=A0ABW0QV78_9BACL